MRSVRDVDSQGYLLKLVQLLFLFLFGLMQLCTQRSDPGIWEASFVRRALEGFCVTLLEGDHHR